MKKFNMQHICFSAAENCLKKNALLNCPLLEFIEANKSGSFRGRAYKELIKELRHLKSKLRNPKTSQEDIPSIKSRIDEIKTTQLAAFIIAGYVEGYLKSSNLRIHSGLIILDFDYEDNQLTFKDEETIERKKRQLATCPHVLIAYISPGGLGLKVVSRIPESVSTHKICFDGLTRYFKEEYDIIADQSGKNVDRLALLSYDPYLVLNENCIEFIPPVQEQKKFQANTPPQSGNLRDDLQRPTLLVEALEKEGVNIAEAYLDWIKACFACASLGESGRELFHRVSAISSKYDRIICDKQFDNSLKNTGPDGISIGTLFYMAKANGIVLPKNIHTTLTSVDTSFEDADDAEKIDSLKSTPCFDQKILKGLPNMLLKGVEAFNDPRKRDVFLVSALSAISGCLHHVYVLHDKFRHSCNLFLFISAPPASSKSTMRFGVQLVEPIHEYYQKKSKEASIAFKNAWKEWKNNGEEMGEEQPSKDPNRFLFIPANSSSAAFFSALHGNGGWGIIMETEGDSLTNTFGQEWGNFSDWIRKAFHNEPITMNRKDFMEEIREPYVSVILSGTPQQLFTLIPNAENGLQSRFLYYVYKVETVWNPEVFSTKNLNNFSQAFDGIGAKMLSLHKMLIDGDRDVHFGWTDKQIEKLNAFFPELLDKYNSVFKSDTQSLIFRLGLIASRLAAIISILRQFEEKELTFHETGAEYNMLGCSDQDQDIVLHLINVLAQHGFFVFENLPGAATPPMKMGNTRTVMLYQALPKEFLRKDAIDIGKELGIPQRSADLYLKALCELGMLTKIGNGSYKKTE